MAWAYFMPLFALILSGLYGTFLCFAHRLWKFYVRTKKKGKEKCLYIILPFVQIVVFGWFSYFDLIRYWKEFHLGSVVELNEKRSNIVRLLCDIYKVNRIKLPTTRTNLYTYFTDFECARYFCSVQLTVYPIWKEHSRSCLKDYNQYARAHLMAITLNITITLYD